MRSENWVALVAQAIREQRSRHPPKTQEDIAHEAGLSLRHYQRLEGGLGDPKLTTLLNVAAALGVKLQRLLDKAEEIAQRDGNGSA